MKITWIAVNIVVAMISVHSFASSPSPLSCMELGNNLHHIPATWYGLAKKNCFIFLPNYQLSPSPLLLKKRSKSSPPAFLLDVLRSQVMMLGWGGSLGRGGLGRFQATPDNYHDFYCYHHCYCHDWYHHEWLPVKISKGTFHAMPFNDQDDEDRKYALPPRIFIQTSQWERESRFHLIVKTSQGCHQGLPCWTRFWLNFFDFEERSNKPRDEHLHVSLLYHCHSTKPSITW